MNDHEAIELLSRVLDGHADDDDRARLLAWIGENGPERGEVAEQLVLHGLLGVALEDGGDGRFRQRLRTRLIAEGQRNIFRRIGMALRKNTRRLALAGGPLLAVFTWFSLHGMLTGAAIPSGDPAAAAWAGAVLALCAVWWVFEPIPIGATSLIPLALLPLAGVLDERQIAASYGHHLVILFLSGFMLSRAMERSGAHRRVALGMVRIIGGAGGKRLVLGFMVASGGLSMWISNTATVLILLPVAMAVIDQCRGGRLTTPLLLGTAYAASIGGIISPIGTPPNAILIAQADMLAAQGISTGQAGFMGWVKVGLPVGLIMIPLAWLWLTRGHWPRAPLRIAPVGAWEKAEVRVCLVLGITALLWTTRADPFGGWSGLLGEPSVKDSTVGLLAVLALFLIPSGNPDGGNLLEWDQAVAIPWNILILLGGGIAIGNAFSVSGLSEAIAGNLTHLAGLPALPMVVLVVLCVSLLTEVTSNTATATVLLPLLAATAMAADLPPMLLMVPAAMATSCAFMLPVATPSNAIVFAVGEFSIRRMLGEGFVLNLMAVVVITGVCYWLLA